MIRGAPRPGHPARIELSNHAVFETWAGVVATGVHYRRLDVPGVDERLGAGVHYGSSPSDAAGYAGRDVFVVGAGNSAGQAALHLAEHARRVTLVARRSRLSDTMSSYLIGRIDDARNISVLLQTEIEEALGDGLLEELVVVDRATGERTAVPADGLFVLIGGEPLTAGYEGWLRRDDRGFLVTGSDLLEPDEEGRRWWPLERAPMHLESSQPGMFVSGDVRSGSVKRVASAVGEGAMAIQLVHRLLAAA